MYKCKDICINGKFGALTLYCKLQFRLYMRSASNQQLTASKLQEDILVLLL